MNSGTVLAGTAGCSTIKLGTRMMAAIGAMSRMKLKLSFFVKCGVDRVRRRDHEERIAVRGCVHDRLGGDIVLPAPGLVLDDELLTESPRQPLAHRRAMMSFGPPAGKPEIKRTGRDG